MADPYDPGFAVNVRSGEYHRKYAPHARGMRRTTTAGMYNLLDGRPAHACPDCFPPPKPAKKAPKAEPKASGFELVPDELVFDGPEDKG